MSAALFNEPVTVRIEPFGKPAYEALWLGVVQDKEETYYLTVHADGEVTWFGITEGLIRTDWRYDVTLEDWVDNPR